LSSPSRPAVGVVFPTYEIGRDPGLIREFGQAAEELGYSHLVVYDHVLGAHPDRDGWLPGPDGRPFVPHTHLHPWHEAMVTMGFLAGATTRIGFMTGVLVLPQRQTALVAKQAAELAMLRPGGFRLGVGTGWNFAEYEALGADFAGRGKRMDEQVEVMRELWAHELVSYQGSYHTISRAGINPRPPATVPVWFGGASEAVLRRCAQTGDGWVPLIRPGASFTELRDRLYDYAARAGRDPASIGIEVFTNYMPGTQYSPHKDPDPELVLADAAERWAAKLQELAGTGGITHVSVMTMDYGLPRPQDHLTAIRRYAEAIGLDRTSKTGTS
jgi:probable F420-dependent oxidoreductase